MRVSLVVAAAMVWLVTGCANSPFRISHMSPDELTKVSDERLCNAALFFGEPLTSKAPNVQAEVSKRSISCNQFDPVIIQAVHDDSTCKSYGATPGTDVYIQCRLMLLQQRQQADIAAAALHAQKMQDLSVQTQYWLNRAGPSPLPSGAYTLPSPPMPQTTNCYRNAWGFNCTTW
jgi:hypothetical protein